VKRDIQKNVSFHTLDDVSFHTHSNVSAKSFCPDVFSGEPEFWDTFSKVICIVILHSKFSTEPDF